MEQNIRAAVWKRGVATFLDLFTAFLSIGWVIGKMTGNITPEGGFQLSGGPALLLFALVGAYFFIGRRFAGGTLWDRVFGIKRPQPE